MEGVLLKMNYADKATELLETAIKSDVAEMPLRKLPINGYHALRSAVYRQKKLIAPEIAERIVITKIRYKLYVTCLPPNFADKLAKTVKSLISGKQVMLKTGNKLQMIIATRYLTHHISRQISILEGKDYTLVITPTFNVDVISQGFWRVKNEQGISYRCSSCG